MFLTWLDLILFICYHFRALNNAEKAEEKESDMDKIAIRKANDFMINPLVYPTVQSIVCDLEFKTFGRVVWDFVYDVYGNVVEETDHIGAKNLIVAQTLSDFSNQKLRDSQKPVNCIFLWDDDIEAKEKAYTKLFNKVQLRVLDGFKGHCK